MAPTDGMIPGLDPLTAPVPLLLVDDRPENLTALTAVLEQPDYRLVTATSGEEALKLMLKEDFAVLLIDVMMPGMDGFELARLVRQRPRSSEVPILFVTAVAQEVGYLYRGYSVGAVDYLVKPIDPAIVRAKVAVFVALHRQRQAIVHQARLLIESERLRTVADMARLQAESAQQRASFLVEMSQRLTNTLDPLASLNALTQLAAGVLCEWCVVDLVNDNGQLEQMSAAHQDAAKADLLGTLRRDLQDRDGDSALDLALRTQEAQISAPDCDPASVAKALRVTTPEVVDQLNARGFMCLPLVARGRTLGILSLVSAGGPQNYNAPQVAMAIEVGQQAAIALDNAQLYQQARRAVRLRDEFISLASHELRTPVTVLNMQIQAMLMGATEPGLDLSAYLKKLANIKRQADRLTRLINEMLSVTRLIKGGLHLKRESVDLASAVRDVTDRMQLLSEKSGVPIEVQTPPELIGQWDAMGLDQVVTNLVDNAIKFSQKKPVSVRLEQTSDGQARLTVQDHGIGMTPETQERIFGLYERGVPSDQYGGLGLGLFIARQIITTLGGRISVTSAVDAGTTFTVELPLTPASDQMPPSQAA